MPNEPVSEARRALETRIATSLDISAKHEIGRAKVWLSDAEMGMVLDALRAEPARGAEEMRERAARAAEWFTHHLVSGNTLAKHVRALPLPQDEQGGEKP